MIYKYAVIMAHQRSGTHMLGACMSGHPRVKYTGEIFCRNAPITDVLLEGALQRVTCGDFDVICLDIKYNQISRPIERWMAQDEVKVIHLTREDLLRLYFSGEAHTWRGMGMQDSPLPVFQFKPEQFKDICTEITLYRKKYEWLADLDLTYENLTHNRSISELPPWATRSICDLLGLEYHTMGSDLVKESPYDYIEHLQGVPADILEKYGQGDRP